MWRAKPAVERFWAKVEKTDGCWNWTASLRETGYGQFVDEDLHPVRAHRFAYSRFVGPIPDGLFVCHSCDNRRCVRPDHLFLGTNQDNMRDAVSKGRINMANLRLGRRKRAPMPIDQSAAPVFLEDSKPQSGCAARSRCKYGHIYTPENTRVVISNRSGRAFRVCRLCRQRKVA